MFSAFKILVTCLIISSRCTRIPIPNGETITSHETKTRETKTLTFKEKIEQEWAPIEENLKIITDSQTSNDEKLVLRGEVQGSVKKIIERAVKAENENKILIKDQGRLEHQKEKIIRSALKTFVVPYVCRNFELYEKVWDNGGKNSENFDPDVTANTDVKRHDLDTQTMSNYKNHAKVWDRILTSSAHPLVKDFKGKIKSLYPELTLPMVAKNLGLIHALLNNAKHGVINDEPEMAKFINPDDLVVALKAWGALKDPVVLGIIKTFEEVVSGSVSGS